MSEPKKQNTQRSQFLECGIIFCVIFVGIGIATAIWEPIRDWRQDTLKPLIHYIIFGGLRCLPFFIGFLIFAWFFRRDRSN
jgi:hypothetical protein